jgi:hypothetical protein
MEELVKLRSISIPRAAAVLAISASSLLLAPSAWATKYAGAFMADGGGARALGMGSAFVAVADDASASFWNPAGLVNLPKRQILVMHSERFGDLVDRDFATYAQPLRGTGEGWSSGAFAFSVIRLGIDDIAFTDHLRDALDDNGDGVVDDTEVLDLLDPVIQDQIRYESDQELAFFGSYARYLGEWAVGGNFKFVRQSVGSYSSVGVGVDLGAWRDDWWKRLDVGLKLQDITTTYLSWSTGRNETINPVIVPGVAYDWTFPDLRMDLRAAAAAEIHFDNRGTRDASDPNEVGVDQFSLGGSVTGNGFLGLEVTLSELAHLRFGSHGGFDAEELTYGAGLQLGRLRVDYALAGDTLDIDQNTHRVSVAVDF